MDEEVLSSANMKLKRIFFFALLVLAHTARADTKPIRIGALMVLTGQYAMQGTAFREGIELAVAEINDTGGIGGKKLEFVPEDTGNLAVNALTAARRLLQVDGLVAVITTSYPELATGAAEFQRKKIPVVHLWDASPDIEAMGDYLFGIGPWTPSAGEVSARFAISNLKARTVVTFRINDPWSELVTGYFEQSFTAQGGRVLQSYSFNPQEQDFRTVFSKARGLRPDVIYSPVGDNIVPFYVQLRQQIPDIPVVSSDVIAEEHIRQAPVVFEGIYQSQMKDPSGPDFERVAIAYQKRFNKAMTLPWFVCTAYDGVKLLSFCAKKVGTNPAAVRDCIAETKNLSGVTQTFSFTPGGSSPQTESIFRLHKGLFVYEQLS
jgi:branched-chain amino acid transport system substrate-binding protein